MSRDQLEGCYYMILHSKWKCEVCHRISKLGQERLAYFIPQCRSITARVKVYFPVPYVKPTREIRASSPSRLTSSQVYNSQWVLAKLLSLSCFINYEYTGCTTGSLCETLRHPQKYIVYYNAARERPSDSQR